MKKNKRLIALALTIIFIIVIFLIIISGEKDEYMSVDELMNSKDEFVGKNVKVRGYVKDGSVDALENGSYIFVLSGGKSEVRVISSSLPSNFNEGKDVIVSGRFTEDYKIIAAEIIVGCPSKYG